MEENTLLVVDDSPLIQRILSMILRKAGFNVVTASDGEEALEKARKVRPRVIFLDAMMPKKDGYQVAQELRASTEIPEQPYIIMLTALEQPGEKERARAIGVNEVMTKPFSPEEIVDRVKKVVYAENVA